MAQFMLTVTCNSIEELREALEGVALRKCESVQVVGQAVPPAPTPAEEAAVDDAAKSLEPAPKKRRGRPAAPAVAAGDQGYEFTPAEVDAVRSPPAVAAGDQGYEFTPAEVDAVRSPPAHASPVALKEKLIAFAHAKGFDEATALLGRVKAGAEKFRDLDPSDYPALEKALNEGGA